MAFFLHILLAMLAIIATSERSLTELQNEDGTSPIAKVLEMISDLQGKTIAEGEKAQKVYAEFSEFCDDRSRDLGFEIKTSTAKIEDLEALIEKQTATAEELTAKLEDLAGSLAADEKELKEATAVRQKEAEDFGAESKELSETIDMLVRAVEVLSKGGASMLQSTNAGNLAQAMNALVQADEAFSSADASKLTALVQSASSESDEDSELGGPAGAVYESKSGDIVETVQGLQEKAEDQLDVARKKETESKNNFELVKQSLTSSIKNADKDKAAAKKGIAESEEVKSKAEGDLTATKKDLSEDQKSLSDLHADCMTKAQDFETEVASRDGELKALAQAKKIIVEATGGGAAAASFLQMRTRRTRISTKVHSDVAHFIRELAQKKHSSVLAQLASKVSAITRAGGDVFGKVKGLIKGMIAKLEDEATAEAEKKAYCDEELSESKAKQTDKETTIKELSTKIDKSNAKSAKLDEEVAELQAALAKLAQAQSQMDKARADEKALYTETKAELDKGLRGIQLALKVLRDYYAKQDKSHDSGDGAASGIISLLEVAESDIAKELSEVTVAEENAQAMYEQDTQDNKLESTTKNQDVKYKQKESAGLKKAIAELGNDREGEQDELDAVNTYLTQLEGECATKVESYADQKKKREEEIAGLKEGLEILENEAALIQVKSSRRALRSINLRAA